MSKRGLSMEEKKTKMIELFHETMEFFSLKELEKQASSENHPFAGEWLTGEQKGIVVQSVKDVIDDLVSDGLVNMDKIGTGNLSKAQAELDGIEGKLKAAYQDAKQADKGREDTPERREMPKTLAALQEESNALKAELAAFGAADPVKYEEKKKATEVCKAAALRWTDNTVTLMGVAKSNGASEAELREMMGISEDWEDLPQ